MSSNPTPTPTHYFVHVGQSTQTKNALQAEFYEYLKFYKGTLIEETSLWQLQKDIIERCEDLNSKYSRCTPLKIDFTERYSEDGYGLSGFPFLSFNILNANLTNLK